MAVRGKNQFDVPQTSVLHGETSRWPLSEQEQLREEVARMLDGNVQAGLSACNVWLSMAEQLLAGAHMEAVEAMFGIAPDGGPSAGDAAVAAIGYRSGSREAEATSRYKTAVPPASGAIDVDLLDDRVTQRIVGALSLLYKVRGEVERLRKSEVQRAVDTLYPTLINVGLRPALDSLLDTMRIQSRSGEGHIRLVDGPDEVASSNELGVEDVGPSERGMTTVPTVTWLVDEPFSQWDQPTCEQQLLNVRLEAYRFLEAVVRAAQAGYKVHYLSRVGAKTSRPPHLDVWLNIGDGCLHILVHAEGAYGPAVDEKIFGFILHALPRERLEQAGGELAVTSAIRGGLQIAASLPVA